MTTIKAYNVDTKDFDYLKMNSNGLITSGGSSGSGASGNVYVSNQISGFATQTTLSSLNGKVIVCDTGNIGGEVSVSNQISGFATQATLETLEGKVIVCDTGNIGGEVSVSNQISGFATQSTLSSLLTVTTPLKVAKCRYNLSAASGLAGDTVPQFTSPPASFELSDGWYYKNLASGNASQLYYFSYLNPAMQVPARQTVFTRSQILGGYAVVRILAVNSSTGLTHLCIYTQPTGSGDFSAGFFKSRWAYTIPSGSALVQGMEVMIWWGTEPDARLHPTAKRIELTQASVVGPASTAENVAFLSVNTDSAASVGNAEYIIKHAGFVSSDGTVFDTQLTAEPQELGADASATHQLTHIAATNAANAAVCTRLDSSNLVLSNTYTLLNNRLTSMDSNLSVLTSLSDGGGGLDVKMFYQLSSDPNQVIPMVGDISNLFVRDRAVLTELNVMTGLIEDAQTGDSPLHVVVNYADDSVQVYGYDSDLLAPAPLNVQSGSLLVKQTNLPSSYTVENTSGQPLYCQIQNDPLPVLAKGNYSGAPTELKVGADGTVQAKAIVAAVGGTEINSYYDSGLNQNYLCVAVSNPDDNKAKVRAYGYDGTGLEDKQLACTSAGELMVKVTNATIAAALNDGSANPIASTEYTSGSFALNVFEKRLETVTTHYPLGSITGGTQIGSSIEVTGFTSCAVQLYVPGDSVTTSGNVYLEFSLDGVNWGRASSDLSTYVFLTVSSSAFTYLIRQTSLPTKYIRLFADGATDVNDIEIKVLLK